MYQVCLTSNPSYCGFQMHFKISFDVTLTIPKRSPKSIWCKTNTPVSLTSNFNENSTSHFVPIQPHIKSKCTAYTREEFLQESFDDRRWVNHDSIFARLLLRVLARVLRGEACCARYIMRSPVRVGQRVGLRNKFSLRHVTYRLVLVGVWVPLFLRALSQKKSNALSFACASPRRVLCVEYYRADRYVCVNV